ncbi:hypothetical protein [Actinomadura alba]|uniref:Uncharacterized protein n=1 Tax=Actinomadura alba TaxID=406431 RepID=A0ABR7LV74_9ACTN|nr:hypothetical protein [Actinomadura alba]MBC6468755.1 hypothetical protein [Actinomadura alba]
MALVVTFTGRTPLPAPGAGTGFKIWSYRIDPSGPGELQVGQRIAFGLPSAVDVQNPDSYPGVPQLAATFLQRDPSSSRQYVGRLITSPGVQTLSFVAPAAESTCEVFLVKASSGQAWASLPFATTQGGNPAHVQVLPAPVVGPPVFNGRPVPDFAGTLPYASEVFGVYQPLAGWFGAQNTLRAQAGTGDHEPAGLSRESFSGAAARTLRDENLTALTERFAAAAQGVLSPVGLVNLFRQYFFEFDTFLGAPAGHLWISPGGTVEVVETSTRRTLVEKFAEQAEETSRKVEESLTRQDDVADAVKEENANDTKLGVSVTGGVNAPIYHADASASFSTQSTVKSSSEQTHKHTRTQSAKVSSEIKRNFKTTFKTVTETTDTSSRRYVVQNTTDQLVNYELRRKMRKVGVQLQHIGTRLSWQVYFNSPGRDLGLGDLVDIVPAPDLTALKPPEVLPPAAEKQVPFRLDVPFLHDAGPDDEAVETYTPHPDNIDRGVNTSTVGNDDTIQFFFEFPLPPIPAGYALTKIASIDVHGAQVQFTITAPDMGTNPDPVKNTLKVRLTYANFQGKKSMPFDIVIIYTPTDEAQEAIDQINADAAAAYNEQVAQLQRAAYGNAVRNRLKLVSSMRSRPPEDLRSEERQTVFGKLVHRLGLGEDPHLGSELIRQIFDVDEMLYFVAPDFWRPSTTVTHPTESSLGRYPVPAPISAPDASKPLAGATVAGWYSHTDMTNALDPQGQATPEWRVNYLITEETRPAPLGSSLGWLIQIDGDERRNEFLNAAWAKAVLPVRPGHELAALDWLADVEGEAALGLTYPFQPGDPPEYEGLTVEEVLRKVAEKLQESNTDVENLLATEEVYETGFDPLAGGFRPAEPYQVFDQWVEILPTDQVAAVQVRYDPKTGQQL